MDQAQQLAERLCRPQRVGVFGHRGVGKTTLLAALYREAAGGRLPGMRLAAADARTAEYLADKVRQLEAGQVLPATLAETELRWHLYHDGGRVELLAKDYQGEHVELGRSEPIQEFLRDCDVVLLCLDAGAEERLGPQQEVEQFLESVLANEPGTTWRRPVALVQTKSDLLGSAAPRFDLCDHALQTHCPNRGRLAVSSLAALRGEAGNGLSELLTWLVAALQAQDQARLERLVAVAPGRTDLLKRGVAAFAGRYPQAAEPWRQRLATLQRTRGRRRGLVGVAAAACLLTGLWGYDALGYQRALRFEAEHAGNLSAVLEHWRSYRAWHPTSRVVLPGAAWAADARLAELSVEVRRTEAADGLALLKRQAEDPATDAAELWHQFHEYRGRYAEACPPEELERLRIQVQGRRDAQVNARAQRAYEELRAAEGRGTDLAALLTQADAFLRDYPGTARETEVRAFHAGCVRRLDERAIEAARAYSARQPFNFQTRREHYQRYLDSHPDGAFVAEAQAALKAIEIDWDKHDFRAVRDQLLNRPGDLPELVARCRTYLAVHPEGRFTAAATELLRWSERVSAPGEYRVVLRSGQFERGVAQWLTRGPDLSVEIEVAGVRHGPSTIVRNALPPDWTYEFPRRIKWKLGDPVRVRVTDHDYWERVVVDVASADGDPLAISMLSGEVWAGGNGLRFESDFTLPTLPTIE